MEYLEPALLDKQLNVVIQGDMRVRIDRRLFHRSLANLLHNAARYAAPASTIIELSSAAVLNILILNYSCLPFRPQASE